MSSWIGLASLLVSIACLPSAALAGSLADVKHVVLFMQENRAFDHYYGTMAGVRNHQDPNAIKLPGSDLTNFYQPTGQMTNKADHLLPFYLSREANYTEAAQCVSGVDNDWTPNLNAWNNGTIDGWVTGNKPLSWGYFKRSDIPTHFDMVEGWTVGDMYSESVIGPTNPNRVTWASGTINIPGSPPGSEIGGTYIENYENDGCLTGYDGHTQYACYPIKWKSVPEYFEDVNITWRVYQDENNFDDNPFAWFQQYQQSKPGQPLHTLGDSFPGLDSFYKACADGTLPQVSYIVGPMELSEHPPYTPHDGAWLQKKVVDAVTSSPLYNETVLLISYDETGGWGDHVPPFVSPNGTVGEWLEDPEQPRYIPSGPGFRVPFYAISPWTRGGHVFTAPSDHNSQILFLEEWAKQSAGKDITVKEMNPWRRQHMSNLVDLFDFDHPDMSLPTIAEAQTPSTDSSGNYNGWRVCQEKYDEAVPPIPYGNQTAEEELATEQGYKQIRGSLTEGRYLVFKSQLTGLCLTSFDIVIGFLPCENGYKNEHQRFTVEQNGDAFSTSFALKSYSHGQYFNTWTKTWWGNKPSYSNIKYNGNGYNIDGFFEKFDAFSVSYN